MRTLGKIALIGFMFIWAFGLLPGCTSDPTDEQIQASYLSNDPLADLDQDVADCDEFGEPGGDEQFICVARIREHSSERYELRVRMQFASSRKFSDKYGGLVAVMAARRLDLKDSERSWRCTLPVTRLTAQEEARVFDFKVRCHPAPLKGGVGTTSSKQSSP